MLCTWTGGGTRRWRTRPQTGFRIGQQRTVQVRKFICTGTLEEKIDDMIEEKKALADLVVTDGEGWLTELSTRDLREMFALSDGAVGE
jgi:SNF2 family DNA or RNA helicase